MQTVSRSGIKTGTLTAAATLAHPVVWTFYNDRSTLCNDR